MSAIPLVGKCFPTAAEFLAYVEDIKFGAWRPRYVTMHHTGGPSLATWRTYANRKVPITDAQWMKNLAGYYGNEMGWSAGPHFFFTPDNFCVLSLPNKRGVHAHSFNANSWGVECVGEFDTEPFTDALRDRYADGFAALYLALGTTLAQAGSQEAQRVIDYDYQLAFAKAKKIAKLQRSGQSVQRILTHQIRPQAGKIPFGKSRVTLVQRQGNHAVEDAVADEFQALVVGNAEAAVRQCSL